ncbi:MAG: DUF3153 domain-containing protein [Leptolyngbyaceae cyanobacterium RM1_1_2]|nr:DUF3153 domain-containing protein [Leptolyngbyaceae cyanobacterium RM1_1_2]
MIWRRLGLVSCLGLMAILLSGCFRSAIDIRFESQTQGLVTQQIQLEERFAQLSEAQVQQWFAQVAQQARSLGGSAHQETLQTWQIRLPFNNGADLVEKFNRLMATEATGLLAEVLGSNQVRSQLAVKQNNWIFALRNHLTWDLDLRSVKVAQPTGGVLSTLEPLSLRFSLTTPWGLKELTMLPAGLPPRLPEGRSLQLGQLNHMEAVFWVPSPIGLGAARSQF